MQLDMMLEQAATGEEPEVETPEVEEPAAQEEPEAQPETKPEQPKAKVEPKSNPMKEVRDRLNAEQKAKEKIENTVNRFTSGDYKFKIRDFKTEDGKIDYDALSKAMDDEDLKSRSEAKGISPEVQAEIERIEKEKVEIQRERLRVSMDRAIANMQTEMNLTGESINNFFKDSMALHKNPYAWLAQGGTLPDLYYLVYRDKIMKEEINKAVEEAKVKWEQATNKKAPTSNPAASTQTTSSTTLSLNQLLNEAVK